MSTSSKNHDNSNSSGISKKDVLYVSKLSRIKLNESELDEIIPDLQEIVEMVSKLKECSTENVKPLYSVIDFNITPWREDIAKEQNHNKALMECAPKSLHDHYVVPKVVE